MSTKKLDEEWRSAILPAIHSELEHAHIAIETLGGNALSKAIQRKDEVIAVLEDTTFCMEELVRRCQWDATAAHNAGQSAYSGTV
jgi:hypothetical protein